ncbi:glycoside hydrolase family 15 protein [Demequina sp. NBRC 110052]|uniref:glycoside hydrolase family 15 protein n=1 Tax=Demequina sp. NBRC 110052 TaxID=1570341 RepID=UPI000A036063|nr:glycoside hydrolase family 15 protein [Demequina sp. NBRC 110052]
MTAAIGTPSEALITHSRALIRALQTSEGAYPASPTFSAYRGYSWFRDGAFIADGMSAVGDDDSAAEFLTWCASVVRRYAGTIGSAVARAAADDPLPDDEMLPARFTFDGGRGADEWWDFQLDGFGTWLWALGEHVTRHGTDPQPYADAVTLTVDYLVASWRRPCFDWWEEHDEHVHVSTLGCIAAGLTAAARLGVLDDRRSRDATNTAARVVEYILEHGVREGHLVKWIGSSAVDGSLAALISPLRVIPPEHPVATATLAAIERDLAVDHGVHRFAADVFYGGGQWPLLSCFAGLAHAALGERDTAAKYLAWAAAQATSELDLPEQVPHHLLAPEHRQEWIDRWGPVATPLLWSHAMVLRLNQEIHA